MKRLLCLLIPLPLLVILLCGTAAAATDIAVDIDYPVPCVQSDGWVPAWVTIKNPADSEIECQVQSQEYYGEGARTQMAGDYVIKPHSEFRRLVYAYGAIRRVGATSIVSVRYRHRSFSPGGVRLGRSVLGLTARLGTVTGRQEAFDQILDKPAQGDQYGRQATDVVIVEYKDAAVLPDSWLGYDLLQAMVIEDFPYAALSMAQEDAIVHWVENGGTLLVFPGKLGMALQSPLLKRLLDMPAPDAATVPQAPPELGSIPNVSRWNVAVDGADHLPWADVAQCGLGKVVVFKYDLLGPSFSQWNGLGDVLQRTLKIPQPKAREMPVRVRWDGREQKLLKPPAVAGILAIYLLVLGPVNYVFLRRRRKLVLMPLSITLIAIAFTVAIIAFGYLWKGASNELKELSLIRTSPDRTTAYAMSEIALFCSSNRKFEFDFPVTAAVRKVTDRADGSGNDESPMTVVDTGKGVYRAQFTSLMWSQFRMEARAPLAEFGNVHVERQGNTVTVVNATGVDLESCWYRSRTDAGGDSWFNAGRIPQGGRAVVNTTQQLAPPGDVRAIGAAEPWRGESMIIAKAATDAPAIRYKIIRGRAQRRQCDTYITGAAK
ncbi:MAG TPA: hypothetical protein VM223_23555 [Planctomycetota bacterium]|nr:hypothetical protein [Planctomycetota bacterium]